MSKDNSKTNKLRPSPTQHAADQIIGTIKMGNDKNKWIVLPNKLNINKWIKLEGPIKKYYIHWNGDRPYTVLVTLSSIIIFKKDNNDKYTKLVTKIDKYKNIFIGNNTQKFGGYYKQKFTGSSILIETKIKEYIFIGKDIYKFTTTSPITHFYSIMGNSDVPYSFALSDKVYLFIENIFFRREDWDDKTDPYNFYYESRKKKSDVKFTKINVKYIEKYII